MHKLTRMPPQARMSTLPLRGKSAFGRVANKLRILMGDMGEDSGSKPGKFSYVRKTAIVIKQARVLRSEDSVLVFEFETPEDGFLLPDEQTEIRIEFDDGVKTRATVVKKNSTKPGPYAARLTVRLAIRLEAGGSWHHNAAVVYWHGINAVNVEIRISLAD